MLWWWQRVLKIYKYMKCLRYSFKCSLIDLKVFMPFTSFVNLSSGNIRSYSSVSHITQDPNVQTWSWIQQISFNTLNIWQRRQSVEKEWGKWEWWWRGLKANFFFLQKISNWLRILGRYHQYMCISSYYSTKRTLLEAKRTTA